MKQTIIALSPFQGIAPFIVSAPQGYMTTKIVRKKDKMIVTYEPIVNNISKIPVSKIAKLAKTAKMIKSSMKNLKKGKSMEEYIDEAWERNYPKMSETLDLTKKRGKKK